MVSEKTSTQSTWDPLLILRGIACLIVVWAHSDLTPHPISWIVVKGIDFTFLFHPNPYAAVFIFYLISGYVIGTGFVNGKYSTAIKSLFSFYLNRLLRIAPLYYFLIYLTIYFLYGVITISPDVIKRLLTFTATDFSQLSIFSPYAIISTEMQFYVIAPLLFVLINRLFNKFSPLSITLSILILGNIIRFILIRIYSIDTYTEWGTIIYTTVLGNIDIFVSGITISILVKRYKNSIMTELISILRLGTIIALICLYLWSGYLFYKGNWGVNFIYLLPGLTSLIVGMSIFLIGIRQKQHIFIHNPNQVLKRLLSPKYIWESIGVLSYGIYLWHWPLLEILINKYHISVFMQFSTWGMLYRSIGIIILSILLSMITYTVIEYPFLLLKSRLKYLLAPRKDN